MNRETKLSAITSLLAVIFSVVILTTEEDSRRGLVIALIMTLLAIHSFSLTVELDLRLQTIRKLAEFIKKLTSEEDE